jgi:hypothetical protein
MWRRLSLLAVLLICVGIMNPKVLADEHVFGRSSYVKLVGTGCNTASYAQIPGSKDLFVGRQPMTTTATNDCSRSQWEVVLDRLDWKTHIFTLLHPILRPPLTIGGGARITTAYDAFIIRFGGEYWMAFECSGDRIPGASTCMAALTPDAGSIYPARTYLIIAGNRPGQLGDQYSASDPKLLVYQGRLYLYWTAIKLKDNKWVSLATRGAELKQEAGPLRRLWPAGANHATSSFDTSTNQEVWSGADMFSALERNGRIYVTAAVARGNCVRPRMDYPDCFRLVIAEADAPLGPDIFGQHMAASDRLPLNPQDYGRFAIGPDGGVVIIDHVYPPHTSQAQGNVLPEGLIAYPIELKRLFEK